MDIKAFRGLNNVTDPLRLGADWLVQADNVNILDSGALSARDGYSLVASGNYSAIYSTFDYRRCYVVKSTVLQTFEGVPLLQLTSTNPMYWAEVNDNVYFNNGVDSGVIYPDHSLGPWRNADLSAAYGAGFKGDDGTDLTILFDTLPLNTDVIQHWQGRMYAAQYVAADNYTVVWFSEPLAFHLFNNDSNFFMVPGQVLMMAPHDKGLIVGTNNRVYAYQGEGIDQLADYGVVPGQHWSADGDERTLFWTTRGLCAALPFTNLTERQVSVAPGVSAGGTIMRHGGQKRYVVALQQGGAAFNPYV